MPNLTKTIILSLILIPLLNACGGGGSNNSLPLTPASRASINGLWDWSTSINNQTRDELYLEITANNFFIVHDYQADSFNRGQNCYITKTHTLSNFSNGNFTVTKGYNNRINIFASRHNNLLTLISSDNLGVTMQALTLTTLNSANFTPCGP